jgi:hypothetical protein
MCDDFRYERCLGRAGQHGLDDSADELGAPWQPTFPGAELVQHVADLMPDISGSGGAGIAECPRWEIVVSPGVFRARTATTYAANAVTSARWNGTGEAERRRRYVG